MNAPITLPDIELTRGIDQFTETPAGIKLCFRTYGAKDGTPLLLIAGLGLQLTSWPDELIDAFTSAGCFVIAPDNRDAGRSSSGTSKPPGKLQVLLGAPPARNYSLDDMADDIAHLLRALHIERAHIVGMSMGGMIAQTLAVKYPERVLSLTSIFSTTGNPHVGRPAPSTLWRIFSRAAPRTSAQAVENYVSTMHHIGDPHSPGIEAVWSAYALQAWERNGNRANASGFARQISAIQKSGDRSAQLRHIHVPTLVLHGDIDLMVDPSGGRATATIIPGAELVIINGMRHQIDAKQSPDLALRILALVKSADATFTNR